MKARVKVPHHSTPNRVPKSAPGVLLHKLLQRLLVDVLHITGLPIEAPLKNMNEWILIEGPRLNKHILRYIEMNPSCYFADSEVSRSNENCYKLWVFLANDASHDSSFQDYDSWQWLWPLIALSFHPEEKISVSAFQCLQQVLAFGYKSELQPTSDQVTKADESFDDTDAACLVWRAHFESHSCNRTLFDEARKIVSMVTHRADFTKIVGRHGPGGVFPPCKPQDKTKFNTCYRSIDRHYGYADYFNLMPSFWWQEAVVARRRTRECDSIVAKITAVPKDSRGPRLICVHPKEAIWIQLGQSRVLMDSITSHWLTADKIKFEDQSSNGGLALSSSSDRAYCTIDLKDASDRIDQSLVRHLFGDYQYELLSCARADKYIGLDGELKTMNKWAPMGNGLTFPVQSLVFFALVVAGIRLACGNRADAQVHVFGDDILCPSKYYHPAIAALTAAGLIPNASKCYAYGFYRESCGIEAFRGFKVSPVRVKKGMGLTSCAHGVCLCTLAKRLRIAGYYHAAAEIYSRVSSKFGLLPKSNNPDYCGLYEWVNEDFGTLYTSNSYGTMFRRDWQLWGIEVRSVAGTTIVPVEGDWNHLQDSLSRISSQEEKCDAQFWERDEREFFKPLGYASDTGGLAYPRPYRERTCKGFVPHLM